MKRSLMLLTRSFICLLTFLAICLFSESASTEQVQEVPIVAVAVPISSPLKGMSNDDIKEIFTGSIKPKGVDVDIALPMIDSPELEIFLEDYLDISWRLFQHNWQIKVEKFNRKSPRHFESKSLLNIISRYPSVIGVLKIDPKNVRQDIVILWRSDGEQI